MRATVLALLSLLPAAAQPVRLPDFTREVLPNGAVLLMMPQAGVPLVTIRAAIRGGVEAEPQGLSGLARITADMLEHGTRSRPADRFADELDALGATFSTAVTQQSTVVGMEAMSKDLSKAAALLFDALQNPAFSEAEVKKKVAQSVDEARNIKDDPNHAVSLYFRSLFFGPSHPYGRPADELSIARIQRADIVNAHASLYAGRNLIVAVAGGFDPSTASPLFRKALGAVPAGNAYRWKQMDLPEAHQPTLAIVDKPDAAQTQFILARNGISRSHPDRIPLWLVNTAFGGRFTSLLNDALRVNSGLTYGANSRFDMDHLRGAVYIQTYTPAKTTVEAVDLALATMKKLYEEGLTPELLATSKAYIKGTYPADRLETSDRLAALLIEIELNDLARAEVDDLFARIDAVTLEQANAIATRYYDPSNLTIVLLGNAAQFRDGVGKYAREIRQIPISAPGLGFPRDAPAKPASSPAPSRTKSTPRQSPR